MLDSIDSVELFIPDKKQNMDRFLVKDDKVLDNSDLAKQAFESKKGTKHTIRLTASQKSTIVLKIQLWPEWMYPHNDECFKAFTASHLITYKSTKSGEKVIKSWQEEVVV